MNRNRFKKALWVTNGFFESIFRYEKLRLAMARLSFHASSGFKTSNSHHQKPFQNGF